MTTIEVDNDVLRALYRKMPGYQEGMTFSDFITGKPGGKIRYDFSIRTFYVDFVDDSEAVIFKLTYGGKSVMELYSEGLVR